MKTTLCYLEQEDCYLMMHRIKKKDDINEGKWIGLGGKFIGNESPEECLLREIKEEINVELLEYVLRGVITFINQNNYTETMYLYNATKFLGNIDLNCSEGELAWVRKDSLMNLPLWEGDKYFLEKLIKGEPFFTMKLCYNGDKLIEAYCNDEKIK